jgi:hypothetical protein
MSCVTGILDPAQFPELQEMWADRPFQDAERMERIIKEVRLFTVQ